MPRYIIKPECCYCECCIEDGEEYYDIKGDIICEGCIDSFLSDNKYTLDIAGDLADEAYDAELDRRLEDEL